MKKFILGLIIFLSLNVVALAYNHGYNMNVPLEGTSIATDAMQFDIVNDIYKKLSKKYPLCYEYSIDDTQIVHFPYDVKKKKDRYVAGYWKELWTANACDTKVQIPITFYITKKKTIYKFDIF